MALGTVRQSNMASWKIPELNGGVIWKTIDFYGPFSRGYKGNVLLIHMVHEVLGVMGVLVLAKADSKPEAEATTLGVSLELEVGQLIQQMHHLSSGVIKHGVLENGP